MDTTLASLVTNKRRVSALKSLGIVTVGDALTYYPFRVTEPVPLRAIREAAPGQQMAFAAVIRDMRVVPMNVRRGYRLEATVDDADFARSRRVPGGAARLTFFSYRKSYVDWVSMRLRAGTSVVVSGMPSEYMGQLQFTHPEILTVAPGSAGAGAGLEGYARGAASGNGAFAGSTDPYASVQSAYPPAAAASSGAALKYDADTVQEALTRVCRPRPVYHASSRISSEHIHETILGLLWMMGARTSSTPDGQLAGAGSAGIVAPTTDTIAVQNGEENSGTTAESGAEALSQSIPDVLPESVRKAKNLMHRAEAFLAIHDPASTTRFKEAIETLRYEEAFVSQTSLLKARSHAHKSAAHSCPLVTDSLRDQFIASLPFSLTAGQQQVIHDIAADLAHDWPMQRLLQGEVGSGKTVVALAAMLQAVDAGYQAVLVAPTQVLAEQHAETIGRMVEQLKPAIPVTLLTGGMKLAARRKALAAASSGEPGIIVATHAAFSKTFQAPHLALVVIDEQHRFGVEQRESLNAKTDDGTTPHLLVMTATPIPRTAAMTWFGDLDISWLTELPGGRKPIRTVVVNEADAATMGRMFAHIRARVDAGERAYIVCPRIDADDEGNEGGSGVSAAAGSARGRAAASGSSARTAAGGRATRAAADAIGIDDPYETFDENGETVACPPLHAVAEIADRLQKLPQFQGIRFATLTGRDKDDVKTQVMADFAGGETPILVSTTVIEVGVDVKQASCIVIFDADRYGLSQLHQLRGRVGRGGTNSWAFLISRAEPGSPAEQRLEVIHHSLDGAEIAQADLEFRGAGDVLGDAQSGGKSSLKLLRVVKDADMIADARTRAEQLLAADPELADEVQLAGAVLDFTRGNETFLTSS
ncbi:ATP-dependent DNA helicase RecG [Bifidobacterium longum subsp. longum]|uniref:ATP-dependent DNA helicase RecG n=2 Tax=Bifidobacterium longum TaxID=216816 RepID=A0A9Q8VII7_BIFLL|nr:ATP-dependent DNA helicase RecG [Bifidobacterium longum subsp. longum]UNL68468.1 ATP-dependent DNA helicase RecG [Bifidobacterium longum subsp. longum]UNL70418.1 ATP-dependent DNA helicase RecG [Bifidobacterium longum subsp. longum]UNL72299.1 ATP-dependent DNA helicase RecG [Bifidobacterium longum subsp. longum]UNL82834.1 ATP-dependent DNA helicase RecG [Bifidobacterium longum subsp. longum]